MIFGQLGVKIPRDFKEQKQKPWKSNVQKFVIFGVTEPLNHQKSHIIKVYHKISCINQPINELFFFTLQVCEF